MIHWCADETAAVVTLFSALPIAWRWLRAWFTENVLRRKLASTSEEMHLK